MELLRIRTDFRRLWLGDMVSLLGDWLSLVAVSVLALNHGQGVLTLALVLVAHTLPQTLAAPLAGVLVDRVDRRKLLVIGNLIQAGLTALMALAAAFQEVGLVQLALLLRTAVAALTVPAQNSALPRLVEQSELYRANAILSATWSITFALGMALGGLLAALGPVPALLIDALTFVLAAALLRRLPKLVPERNDEESAATGSMVHRAIADLRQAWLMAWRSPPLLSAVIAKTPLALAGGGAWLLLNLNAAQVGIVSAGLAVGLLQAARGIGTGVGPWLMARRLERGLSPQLAMRYAQWGTFVSIAWFSLGGSLPILLVCAFAWGLGIGTNWTVSTAELQRQAPDQYLGRLSAIDGMLFSLGMSISALIGAISVDMGGVAALAGWIPLGLGIGGWMITQLITSQRPLARLRPRPDVRLPAPKSP